MGLLGGALRGAIAGAVATAAMDLLWYRRYRADGGDEDLRSWEFSTSATDFGEDAPAPARVGRRLAAIAGVELDESAVGATTNVVHWLTGIGWGQLAGVASAALPVPALGVGVATGVTAWGTSYAALGAAGIYEPIWSYDRATLWKDLSAHLVFATTLGTVLSVAQLCRNRNR